MRQVTDMVQAEGARYNGWGMKGVGPGHGGRVSGSGAVRRIVRYRFEQGQVRGRFVEWSGAGSWNGQGQVRGMVTDKFKQRSGRVGKGHGK